jgi:hypothetical protein
LHWHHAAGFSLARNNLSVHSPQGRCDGWDGSRIPSLTSTPWGANTTPLAFLARAGLPHCLCVPGAAIMGGCCPARQPQPAWYGRYSEG